MGSALGTASYSASRVARLGRAGLPSCGRRDWDQAWARYPTLANLELRHTGKTIFKITEQDLQ